MAIQTYEFEVISEDSLGLDIVPDINKLIDVGAAATTPNVISSANEDAPLVVAIMNHGFTISRNFVPDEGANKQRADVLITKETLMAAALTTLLQARARTDQSEFTTTEVMDRVGVPLEQRPSFRGKVWSALSTLEEIGVLRRMVGARQHEVVLRLADLVLKDGRVKPEEKKATQPFQLPDLPLEAKTTHSAEPVASPRTVTTNRHNTTDSPIKSSIYFVCDSEERAENWQSAANCGGVDPDMFYPARGESVQAAKAVCAACVVRDDCLDFALANGEKFGIWGGLSERERRRIRRRRSAEITEPASII